jgi:predicted O-methyltransferase YrrM
LPGPVKKISDIAKYSLKPKKQARLLASVIEYFEVKNVLELGTSLGITTSYFALSKNKPKVITLEGCPEISNIAKNTFDNLNIKNIELITGEFGNTLHEALNLLKKVDFVFFDGNHNYKSTLQYYKQCLNFKHNNTIFVFDDIHLTDNMEKAWNEIKSDNNVTVTIDMFFFGIVFFKKELYKQNFLIRQ